MYNTAIGPYALARVLTETDPGPRDASFLCNCLVSTAQPCFEPSGCSTSPALCPNVAFEAPAKVSWWPGTHIPPRSQQSNTSFTGALLPEWCWTSPVKDAISAGALASSSNSTVAVNPQLLDTSQLPQSVAFSALPIYAPEALQCFKQRAKGACWPPLVEGRPNPGCDIQPECAPTCVPDVSSTKMPALQELLWLGKGCVGWR
jgi:hypothetical protein